MSAGLSDTDELVDGVGDGGVFEGEAGVGEPAWVAAATGEREGGVGPYEEGSDVDERGRCWWRPGPVEGCSQLVHHFTVLDGVRGGEVDDAVAGGLFGEEADGADEVVGVEPADPLVAVADASAESPAGDGGESFERGRVAVEDDAGA